MFAIIFCTIVGFIAEVIYAATEANMPLFRAINPDDELLRKKAVAPK